jgi:hypothetical protein
LSPRGTTFFGNRLGQRSQRTPITGHSKIDAVGSDIAERKQAGKIGRLTVDALETLARQFTQAAQRWAAGTVGQQSSVSRAMPS